MSTSENELSTEKIDQLKKQYVDGPRYWTGVGSIIGATCLVVGSKCLHTILNEGFSTADLLGGTVAGLCIGIGFIAYAAYKLWQTNQAQKQLQALPTSDHWNDARGKKLVQEAATYIGWSTILKPGIGAGLLATSALFLYDGIKNAAIESLAASGVNFIGFVLILGSIAYNYYRADEATDELKHDPEFNEFNPQYQFAPAYRELISDQRAKGEKRCTFLSIPLLGNI